MLVILIYAYKELGLMKYCKKCLMPDTRPGIRFENDVCVGCIHYEDQKKIDWNLRKNRLKELCEKHRNLNNNQYNCAIAVSGGKDSHFQVYYMKEVMKMNPILLAVENIDSTETGRKNIENLKRTFDCDLIEYKLDRDVLKKLTAKTFEMYGAPTWYIDSLIYSFPIKKTMELGLKLLVYGEDVNYTYGGKYDEETESAIMQPMNDVVKSKHEELIKKDIVSEKELEPAIIPSIDKAKKYGLEPIYLSYHHNYEVAKRWGFRHLGHEYKREGTIDDYNSIDSITYLLSEFLKYAKYGHSATTQMASRWIRYGMATREKMIPIVKKYDKILDQGIVDGFCSFTGMTIKEFHRILDKWYNLELFEQDADGVWHEKFQVGIN